MTRSETSRTLAREEDLIMHFPGLPSLSSELTNDCGISRRIDGIDHLASVQLVLKTRPDELSANLHKV